MDAHGCNVVHLTAQFAAFLLKMWSGAYSTLRPAEFKHTLSLYHPQFKDYRQHDCQEFLALLLDSLHEHLSQLMVQKEGSAGDATGAAATGVSIARSADLPPECLLLNEEPMELYESSRSSQLSSPRSSSDSVETSSSCTTSCSSSNRAKAAAHSLRSLPIPEEVKQPLFPLSIPSHDGGGVGGVPDLLFKSSSPHSPQKLVMERNLLNSSPDPAAQPPILEKNLLSEISSMMKESKTANVNISTGSTESSANNEICFDSGKFETDPTKPRAAVASTLLRNSTEAATNAATQLLSQQHLAKSKVKNTNVLKEAAKRLNADQNLPPPSSPSSSSSSSFLNAVETGSVGDHQSLPSPNNESSISKKARFEEDQQQQPGHQVINGNGSLWDSLGTALGTAVPSKRTDGQSCSSENEGVVATPKESVVTRTFQGQFRSTVGSLLDWFPFLEDFVLTVLLSSLQVVCCTCKHVSITYEPFMYLSVPLPRALERTLDVIFVPMSGGPSRHQLVLQQYDEMGKVRQMLMKLLDLDSERLAGGQLLLAEVANRVIVRILEDKVLLRQVIGGTGRMVYAFAVPPPAAELTLPSFLNDSTSSATEDADSPSAMFVFNLLFFSICNGASISFCLIFFRNDEEDAASPKKSVKAETLPAQVEHSWKQCAICLEDMPDPDLRKHTSCSCLLCNPCIEVLHK